MMKSWVGFGIVVPGDPVGKARARTVRTKSGAICSYTPKRTVDYENEVRDIFIRVTGKIPYGTFSPLDEPVRMTIRAFFMPPKGFNPGFLVETEDVPCTKRPDADNIAKIILDALNGLAYTDDSKVSELLVVKRYSKKPRVEVNVDVL